MSRCSGALSRSGSMAARKDWIKYLAIGAWTLKIVTAVRLFYDIKARQLMAFFRLMNSAPHIFGGVIAHESTTIFE